MKKKLTAMVLALGAMLGAFGAWNGNLSTLKGDATAASGTVITGTLDADVNVSIAAGATVTLQNANITNTADYDYSGEKCRAGITCLGDATIILAGTNTVKGMSSYGAGIFVPEGNTLTIKGSGFLAASSGGIDSRYVAAGIGCMSQMSCGNIVVEDGTILADGGYCSAGIGSCNGTTCGVITISGGNVVAKGGMYGAGIGTAGSSCAGIIISGGVVTAEGGWWAPGIGCGWFEVGLYACGNITISGGKVHAKGGRFATGIGTASSVYTLSHCGDITIDIGITEVVAEHGEDCDEAIGMSESGQCGAITIAEGLDDKTDGNVRTIKSKPVSVKFNENWVGGKTTTKELYRGDGVLANAPAVSKREGWCFYGWRTAPEGGEPVTDETVVSGDATYYAHWGRPAATFAAGAVSSSESKTVKLTVFGGSFTGPSSVKVFMTYQTAAAADLDLANATVNGVKVKGGLKFPLTLSWNTADVTPYVIEIPLKGDKQVEDDETLTFQLADVVGTEMGETDICTVTVEDPAFDELRKKIEDGTATKAESNTWIKVSHDGIPYFRGVAMPGDGGKVTGSAYCPENKKVTLKASANKGFTFLGWTTNAARSVIAPYPDGYFVATTASLVIDRTAKPAKDTKTSTTLAGIAESTTFYAVFEGDPRVTATPVAFDEEKGLFVASDGGKVTGAGRYAPGKKVTLKATANKGYAFSRWENAGNGELGTGNGLSQSASYTFEMPDEDVDLYAVFVTVEADKGSIEAGLNGGGLPAPTEGEPVSLETNVMAGVYLEWPIAADALSQTTVKVAGLPSGLKFTAKDIVDSKTKQVTVPANTIYGAPTAASKADGKGGVKPSDVKITVTTAGKSSITYLVKLTVDPLPAWAVGTFDGEVGNWERGTGNGESASAEATADKQGTVSLTIATSGKISGKILEGGKTWTLSAGEFSRVENVEDVEKGAVFYATVIGKAGKEVVTNEVTVSVDAARSESAPYQCGFAVGTSQPFNHSTFQPFNFKWTAWQNLWKHESWSAEAKVVAKAPQLTVGDVTLKFGSYGAVTASGKFVTGKDAKGNDVVHSASCSSVLVPCGGGSYAVFVYFPPKAGKFDGYAAEISLLWDGKAFSAVSRAFGIDFYVSSETGDDSNDGKSVGSAFKTIDAALSAAADHQTVAVLAGSYPYPAFYANDVPLGEEAGGAERPVALVALYGRDKTFIEKSLTEDGNAARISGCASSAWSRFEGFTFRGCRPRAGNASRSQFACAYFKDCAFDCMDTSNRTTSAMFLASVLDGCVVRDLAISNYGGVNSDFKNINPSIFCGCLVMDSEVSFSGTDGMSLSQGSHFENCLIAGRGLLSLELCPEPLQWDASLADSENGFDAGCWNCTIIVEDVEYPNGWADVPIFGPSRGVFDAPLRLTDCLVGVDGMVVNETYHASSVVTGCAEAAERLKAD